MPAIGEISGNAKWNGESWDRLSPAELAAQQPASNGPNITPSYYGSQADSMGGPDIPGGGGRFGMNPTIDYTQQLANLAQTAGINGQVVNETNDRGRVDPRTGILVNGNLMDPNFFAMGKNAATWDDNNDGTPDFHQEYFNQVVRDGAGSLGVGGTDTNLYENKTSTGQPLTQSTGRAVSQFTPVPTNGKYGTTNLGYNPVTPAPKSPYGAQSSAGGPSSGSGSLAGTSGAVRPTDSTYGGFTPSAPVANGTPRETGPRMQSGYTPPSLSVQGGGSVGGGQGLSSRRYNSPFASMSSRTPGSGGGAYR